MRGAFRKMNVRSGAFEGRSVGINKVVVPVSRSVKEKGSNDVTTFIEMKERDVREIAEEVGMPADENYQLRDMLAQGIVPEEVPVRGMLDSADALDLSNAGVEETLFNKVSSVVNASKKSAKPAEPAPAKPAEPVEPAPAE